MAAGDGGALDGAADLAAVDILHLCDCRLDDGSVGIGVEVRTAEIADFAKNAKMTAEIADFAKIAKISEGELRQVEQLSQFQPLVILRHRLVGGAHAVVAVANKRVEGAIQQHCEGDLAHDPTAASHAAADAVLNTPITKSR